MPEKVITLITDTILFLFLSCKTFIYVTLFVTGLSARQALLHLTGNWRTLRPIKAGGSRVRYSLTGATLWWMPLLVSRSPSNTKECFRPSRFDGIRLFFIFFFLTSATGAMCIIVRNTSALSNFTLIRLSFKIFQITLFFFHTFKNALEGGKRK